MPDCAEASSYRTLLGEVERFWIPLPDKPEETAEAVLRALWSTACGRPVSALQASGVELPPLDGAALERLQALIERKRAGVPLAHLTGRQTFMGLELLAGPGALIPRRETEIVGRAALAKLHELAEQRGEVRVLDVCTGSGNLAYAYAHHEPRARVHASDLAPEAIELARRNGEHCALAARVELRVGDLFEPFASAGFFEACDLVSCNPPYISTSKVGLMHPEISLFEPQAAFNGGVYGIAILAKLVREAPSFLRSGGWLAFEVGLGQGEVIARQLRKNGAFSAVEACSDAEGEVRALLARRA
jgi:release factor glutamine methyltransferase